MITTDIGKGTFIVTAQDMEQSWTDPLYIDIEGYDPSLFFDEDGTAYIQITKPDEVSMGIYQARIDVTTGEIKDIPKLIWRGTGGRDPEGPHIFKRGDYYFLNIAEGGTREGHMITIARSNDIWGPYESSPHNPVLTNREEPSISLQAIGHADFFTDCDGNWWAVGLCIRALPHFFHHLGRETILVPLTWDNNGWPNLGNNGHVYPQMEGPLPNTVPYVSKTFDDFDSEKLDYQWNYLRAFINEQVSLTTRPGWLHLKGTPTTLNELASPTFIARRQQEFDCSFRTLMEFSPYTSEDEAGLCIFYDNDHHFELAVTLYDQLPTLILRKNVDDIKIITETYPLTILDVRNTRIYLEISATSTNYFFNYSFDNETYHNLGYTYTKHLSTEATCSDFAGVYCGMYAKAGTNAEIANAYFDWFSYTES